MAMRMCDECGSKYFASGKCKKHYRMPSRIPPKEGDKIKEFKTGQNKPKKLNVGDEIEIEEGTFRVVKIQQSWENKPLKKRNGKPIPIMSESYRKRLAEYRIKRDEYFKQHPVCEFPFCNSKDITLHHMKGRVGKDLVDQKNFKSLCLEHHRFVEENPAEALKLGLSKKRLDK